MTVDSARWYAGFGWVDGRAGRPVRRRSTTRRWPGSTRIPRSRSICGDYWDVYRLSFLTGGRVRGVPFPEYPDRFPEVAAGLPGGRPAVLIVRPDGFGPELPGPGAGAEGGARSSGRPGSRSSNGRRGTTP